LFHLLHSLLNSEGRTGETALCFTKSVEAATRLAKLVEFFEEAYSTAGGEGGKKVVVRAFSSELAPGERKKVLKEFKEGKITMSVLSFFPSLFLPFPPTNLPSLPVTPHRAGSSPPT
jgi:ATP-dependent RNA helicase DDX51/DBP6